MSMLKEMFAKTLSRRVLVGPRKRFIFLYHDISNPDAPQHSTHYSTLTGKFREQVEILTQHFRMVSLDEIASENFDGNDRLASLTFDDGFFSVRQEAFPYLAEKAIPFAVFVNAMAVKENRLSNGLEDTARYERKVFLDEDDVKYLAREGVTIGSHSTTHRILSECDDEELKSEIFENKIYLEGLIGTEVRHMAIPYGKREHYDERVLECCRAAGHDYIYSTNPTCFSAAQAGQSPRPLPRLPFLNESREEMFFYLNRPLFKKINI